MRHFKVKTETLFNSTPQFEYFPGLHILNEYQRNYDLNCLRLAFELGREKILIGCKIIEIRLCLYIKKKLVEL